MVIPTNLSDYRGIGRVAKLRRGKKGLTMKNPYWFNKITFGAIGIFSIICGQTLPVFADETVITNPKPLITPTGTVEDLMGIENPVISDLLGGVGGSNEETEGGDNVYQSQGSAYDAKAQSINLILENTETQLGDTQRPTRRLPFANF